MKKITNPIIQNTVLFLLLFFTVAQPYSQVIRGNYHDAGSQAAYDYWLENAYQWGTQIVQNVGPAGFINYSQIYTGFLIYEKLILHLGLTALLVVLVMFAAKFLPNRILRLTFFVSVALFSTAFDPKYEWGIDNQLYLLILLTCYVLFFSNSLLSVIGLSVVLALLSLAKGSLLFMAIAIIGAVAFHYLIHRKFLLATTIIASYSLSLLLIWIILGQNIANLPDFFAGSIAFSSGYSYTNSSDAFAAPWMPTLGFIIFPIVAFAMIFKCLHNIGGLSNEDKLSRIALLAAELLLTFIVWKHGFIRGATHPLFFFQFVLCAFPLFLWWQPIPQLLPSSKPTKPWEQNVYSSLFMLCLIGIMPYKNPSLRIEKNFEIVTNIGSYFPDLQNKLEQTIAVLQMPEVQAIVKKQAVGHFGGRPAPLVYNSFQYATMPSTISFAAWHQWIMEKDAIFYRNENSAPPYLLYTMDTLDNRLIAQDDPLAQLEIFHRYDPIWSANVCPEDVNYKLLKRRHPQPALTREIVGTTRQHQIGDWVAVTEDISAPLRVIVHVPESMFSKIFSMAYKPPLYGIEYALANGETRRNKFIPYMAEEGFLVAPLISSSAEFLAAHSQTEYSGYLLGKSKLLSRITKFRITCTYLEFICADKMDVTFETVHGLEFGRTGYNYELSPQ